VGWPELLILVLILAIGLFFWVCKKGQPQSDSMALDDMMYCGQCGKENSITNKFCSACGKPLDARRKTVFNQGKPSYIIPLGAVLLIGGVIFILVGINQIFTYEARLNAALRDYSLQARGIGVALIGGIVAASGLVLLLRK
jgi:amino acid transporter